MTFKRLLNILDEGDTPTKVEQMEIMRCCTACRAFLHLSQSDMADLTGMSRVAISNAENCKSWSHNYVVYFLRYFQFPKFFDGGEK